MTSRRDFLGTAAGGLVFVGCQMMAAAPASAQQTKRRQVSVNGRRIKTVDIHAHCAVPEALDLMGQKLEGLGLRPDLDMAEATAIATRLKIMDEQGIDVQTLSINASWYKLDRDRAEKVIKIQNEKLAEACAKNPDRFVALASVALQFPELAAQQLEEGVKKYGLRGAAIGGNVAGAEISDPKFNPFWAKAEQLGVVVFIHPQGDGAPDQMKGRFGGAIAESW